MLNQDDKQILAVQLLVDKASETGRTPKKTDFDSETACFIKQKLGPWPRALEKAGLKDINDISSKEKSRLKRERIKKNKKREQKQTDKF